MEISYKKCDLNALTKMQSEFNSELIQFEKDETLGIEHFPFLSLALQKGYTKIRYSSHKVHGNFYHIDKEHAQAIAESLTHDMLNFALELTCYEEGASEILASQISSDITIKDFLFSHKSGDECTVNEAISIAKIITKTKAEVFHLWASEFDDGALDALTQTLIDLNNKTLKQYDVCDTRLPEPDDQIFIKDLDELVEKNR